MNVFTFCSFFFEPASLGHSRAKCAAQLLQELNADVNGDYISDTIETVLERNPEFLSTFAGVVATNIKESLLIQLSTMLWELNIPFIYCRSIGFFGTARLQLKEHCIVETHPDNRPNDLRVDAPFDTLRTHLEECQLGLKVPWPVVLYKFVKQWSSQKGGLLPETYRDKCELRKIISDAMTKDEGNYEEAIRAVNTSFGGGRPSADLLALFEDSACTELTKQSNKFWILTRAVRDFCEASAQEISDKAAAKAAAAAAKRQADNGDSSSAGTVVVVSPTTPVLPLASRGFLPVSGMIPDMTSGTANYINLQNVYRAQALADAQQVYVRVQHHLSVLAYRSN